MLLFFSVARSAQNSQAGRANEAQTEDAVMAESVEDGEKNAHRQIGGRVALGAAHEQPIQRRLLARSRLKTRAIQAVRDRVSPLQETPCFVYAKQWHAETLVSIGISTAKNPPPPR
jgi:hypothetical protein